MNSHGRLGDRAILGDDPEISVPLRRRGAMTLMLTGRAALAIIGAGLLWGASLANFATRIGAYGADAEFQSVLRLLSAVLYVVMFLVFLARFRRESRIFTDARCAVAMLFAQVCAVFCTQLVQTFTHEVPGMLVASTVGLVLFQIARSYFNFAVFYHFVRFESAVRLGCVATSAIVALLVLSLSFALPQIGGAYGSNVLAVCAGAVLSLYIWLRQRTPNGSLSIDLHAPHTLPLKPWAFVVYGVCTASLPSVRAFAAQLVYPELIPAALLFVCVLAVLLLGIERDSDLFAACIASLGVLAFFSSSVLGLGSVSLVLCGYICTYLGTCVLFSYGVPGGRTRWWTDPMALTVLGYALGWVLSMGLAWLPFVADGLGLSMAKSLVTSFFGVAVPLFCLVSDRRNDRLRGFGQVGDQLSGSHGHGEGANAEKQISSEGAMGVSRIVELCREAAAVYGLTQREAQVLGYILQGFSEQYIADALTISKTTVHTHMRHVYAKLDVHSRDELAHLCNERLGQPS